MQKNILTRRNFMKLGLQSAAISAATLGANQAFAQACGLTPAQTAGPFYPGEKNFTADNDLTWVAGKRALGQVIYIEGVVTDSNCQPVQGANVEIWQACETGKYNNPKDPNPAKLDPNFKYWGETYTDAEGKYIFKTILPGAYPADTDWVRPPHIHFKVSALKHRELVTQLYFAGEDLNEKDLILLGIPQAERAKVITKLQPVDPKRNLEPGTWIGDFNITLRKVR